MEQEARLQRIDELFVRRQLTKDESLEPELEQLLTETFDDIITLDYDTSRQVRIRLFDYSDTYRDLFFAVQFFILQKRIRLVSEISTFEVPEFLETVKDPALSERFLQQILEVTFPSGSDVRLAEPLC